MSLSKNFCFWTAHWMSIFALGSSEWKLVMQGRSKNSFFLNCLDKHTRRFPRKSQSLPSWPQPTTFYPQIIVQCCWSWKKSFRCIFWTYGIKLLKWSDFLKTDQPQSETSGCISFITVTVDFFDTCKKTGLSDFAFGVFQLKIDRRNTPKVAWSYDLSSDTTHFFHVWIFAINALLNNFLREEHLHKIFSQTFDTSEILYTKIDGNWKIFCLFMRIKPFVLQNYWLYFIHHGISRLFFSSKELTWLLNNFSGALHSKPERQK